MNEPTGWDNENSDPLADFREWVKIYESETPEDVRQKLLNTEALYPTSLSRQARDWVNR